MNIRIEAVTTKQAWNEISRIRAQVLTIECGFPFRSLPEPGSAGVWHFVARSRKDAIGALSVIETTGHRHVHDRYCLSFGENERVARYAQMSILKAYRGRGVFKMLMEAARDRVIRPNGFAVGWLLYPAAYVRSSMLTARLGFTAEASLLTTEFGSCQALVRRELPSLHVEPVEEMFPVIDVCPI